MNVVASPDPLLGRKLSAQGIPSARRFGMHLATIIRRKSKHATTAAAWKGDYLAWGRKFFAHYFEDPFNDMHVAVAKKVAATLEPPVGKENEIDLSQVYIGPRGSAKSSILTFLVPLRVICEGLIPYTIFSSDTVGQAVKYLDAIKEELANNELLRWHYPDACGEGPVWNGGRIVTRNGCCVEALGTGSKIRGRRFGPHRPGLLITDDPEGDQAATSEVKRASTQNWYLKGVLKAGQPKTIRLAVGSKVHRQCLVAHLADELRWPCMEFRSVIDWPKRMDLWDEWESLLFDLKADAARNAQAFYDRNKAAMLEGARVLWPERFPLLELMKERANGGHYAFEAEHQNRPVDPAMIEWMPECFEGDDLWFDEWPQNADIRVMAVDPSKGRTDKPGDYQAIVYMALADGNLYVDADLQRRPIKQFVADVFEGCKVWNPDACGIETVALQELILDEVEQMAARENVLAPCVPIDTEGVPKPMRIRRLGPYVSRRKMRFKRRSRHINLFLDQMRDFPNGTHDDGPDAAEMALRLIRELLVGKRLDSEGEYERVQVVGDLPDAAG